MDTEPLLNVRTSPGGPGLTELPLDQVILGDCREILESLPAESVDVIFADPPYNLQLQQELWRPNMTLVDAVDDDWDRFESFAAYDQFTREWLAACRRVLKQTGTLWVIGSYHNIYRIGAILPDKGFWILNDLVWEKLNPMPNFRGVRFTNAHETLLWVQKEKGAQYTFNYQAMKDLNEGVQMRSDWRLPICTGKERLRVNGQKAHPTQKPEALLYRVLLSSSNSGDTILDPFFGTGTTGAVARRLHRHFIGVERSPFYVEIARQRIEAVTQLEFDPAIFYTLNPRKQARIPFGTLIEYSYLEPGQTIFYGTTPEFAAREEHPARILADGSLEYQGQRGSIHQIARTIRQGPANGWDFWYFKDPVTGRVQSIDQLRQNYREASQAELAAPDEEPDGL